MIHDRQSPQILQKQDMFNIIGNISNRNIITKNSSILVNFDVLNMFPSIDNVLGLEAVSRTLNNRDSPAECILDALELCLECNRSFLFTCR